MHLNDGFLNPQQFISYYYIHNVFAAMLFKNFKIKFDY